MSETRYASVLGLGFGDCGKGLFIDALTRRWQAHTVVRFSGGAQAGHNVVAASPARHHTFSQFGAGTLVPGTRTMLLDPMILHPTALLVEAEALQRIGISDSLSRLMIDGRCRITTPFHQAAGRLRELARGADCHGTCGVGVGETVGHGIAHPDQILRYEHLALPMNRCLEKLNATRATLLLELLPLFKSGSDGIAAAEIHALQDESLAQRWLNVAMALARQSPPAWPEEIAARLGHPGCVLFEGAQGILLDEWRGFHPHTTWSSITTGAVEATAARFEVNTRIEHYGAMRTYLTRHGAGPLPTHDEALDAALPEPHNPSDGWQGGFRRGHPDAVLTRYALDAAGDLSGLLISHMDVFQRGIALKWCEGYSGGIDRLSPGEAGDLSHQAELTAFLGKARPQYSDETITCGEGYLERLTRVTSLPVILGSHGNTAADVRGVST